MGYLRLSLPLLLFLGQQLCAQSNWQDKFLHSLPLMGRRDWIVIADPAYPLKNSSGMDIEATGQSQIKLLTEVLNTLAAAHHVRPVFFTDSELAFVTERDAIGISAYRAELASLLRGGEVTSLPQEQMEGKVDGAARNYFVLVLKSTTMLPYTAVFIQLDNGYWSADAEKRLRMAMQPK